MNGFEKAHDTLTRYGVSLTERARVGTPFYFEPPVSIGDSFFVSQCIIQQYSYSWDAHVMPLSKIGRYCAIARRVTIGAATHPTSIFIQRGQGVFLNTEYEKTPALVTCIGHDVWVGEGAVVLAGITVGTGAVIGANAVVTRNVPPYAIVVGIPARIVRYRFPDEIIQRLLLSEWWRRPNSVIKCLPADNIEKSLDIIESTDICDKFPSIFYGEEEMNENLKNKMREDCI